MTVPRRLAGIELGGTKAIAVLAQDHHIIDRMAVPTTRPDETLSPLIDQLHRWNGIRPLQGIGIASFGPIRLDPVAEDFGCILTTPKPHWTGASVITPIRDRLECPIRLDTDVNAAAFAEHRWGAGRGCASLLYLTIGTGLGGGALIDGNSVTGRLHPEMGHILLRRLIGDPFAGACAFHGDCAEGLLSGPALARRFGNSPQQVAAHDDRWRPVAHDLAQLLTTLIHGYAPNRIIIGGGVGLGVPWLLPMAIDRMPMLLGDYYPDLTVDALRAMVVPAALGDEAGPLGAIALADAADRQHDWHVAR